LRRTLEEEGRLPLYFRWLRAELTREDLESEAESCGLLGSVESEVMCAELGRTHGDDVDRRVRDALGGGEEWILIGGPPCQAYSLAGRARRANDDLFEADEKHFLYREYLRILQVHAPPVFVMENVKGLLSSHHGGQPMFGRICSDLARPRRGLSYEIRSFVKCPEAGDLSPDDFIIESERYGVPQTRHRVILLGIRSDIADRKNALLQPIVGPVKVREVLEELPRIRSRLSRTHDGHREWLAAISDAARKVRGRGLFRERKLIGAMSAAVRAAASTERTGGPFVADQGSRPPVRSSHLMTWLRSSGLGGVIQHEARAHMASDLQRYLFAASFAKVFGMSPKLRVFPPRLMPDHESAKVSTAGNTPFPDRFRVQCADLPSSTVVSHIAKDGHYYIHYDPSQCRSLTVREAARLQTFPDDYYFEGNRTQQYVQVGNAVPPYLAMQLASIVLGVVRPASARDKELEVVAVRRAA
jgi:DNA (cytosine-5)-methyltransferase 1